MWIKLSIFAIFLGVVYGQGTGTGNNNGQQLNTPCLQTFDQAFRKCFADNGGFQLEQVFSVVTNGSNSNLPQGVNKKQLTQSLCSNFRSLGACVNPLSGQVIQAVNPKCTQREELMLESSVTSMIRALSSICGVAAPMPPCLQKFDTRFKSCLQQNNIPPDVYFKLLANTSEGTGMTLEVLKNKTCGSKIQQIVLQCSSNALNQISNDCTQQQKFMVGQSLQNMMANYQSVCTGKAVTPFGQKSPCMIKFEKDLNECAKTNLKVDMQQMMTFLSKGTVPAGMNVADVNKTICSNFKGFEDCGKNAIGNSGCRGRDLLMTEGSFANTVITAGANCQDRSIPGACMLTMQSQFTKCFTKSGLDPKKYFSNQTAHKGSLLGTNRALAEDYCGKRHELYECMRGVMHQCPGAEETMAMTGFDLVAMERAVGILCSDIDDYLAGLKCFENPSQQAQQCMGNMGKQITALSARQLSQGISMDGFFGDFCKIRVEHVKCDTSAWPTCNKKAIDLKRKFECHLLPYRCHSVNEDEIRQICPEEAIVQPDKCIGMVKTDMKQCLTKYGLDPEIFLVNVTHDRTNILGPRGRAEKFCGEKQEVFRCMQRVLEACHGSKEFLEFWGHQQLQLQSAVELLCKDINVYDRGLKCTEDARTKINICIANTEDKMWRLQEKRITMRMSTSEYFKQFCLIRMEHMRCDLDALDKSCEKAVVGLKTEFECKIVQDRCKGFQRGEVVKICNDDNYAKPERLKINNSSSGSRVLSSAILGIISFLVTSIMFFI